MLSEQLRPERSTLKSAAPLDLLGDKAEKTFDPNLTPRLEPKADKGTQKTYLKLEAVLEPLPRLFWQTADLYKAVYVAFVQICR